MPGTTQISKPFSARTKGRAQSGQTLIELALLLPLLALLLLGVIEMGRYAYIGILVGNAAHAGASYGAQSPAQSVDTPGIQAAAENDFSDTTLVSNLTVTSSLSCGCDSGGTISMQTNACSTQANPGIASTIDTCNNGGTGAHWVVMVSVTASGTFNSLFSYPGIPSSITVTRTATMRVAR